MNARQRCRLRRQIRYREKCKHEDEIRQLRLKPKSSRTDDSINVLAEFVTLIKAKMKPDNTTQAASFNNRCLPKAYLYK